MTKTLTPDHRTHDRTHPAEDGRARLVGLFVVYLLLLVWIVLWKLEIPYAGDAADRQVKLTPFVATATNGPSQPFEVAVNLLLFVPFGVYLGLLRRARPWRSLVTIGGTSLALEIAQYVLAVGSTDATDIVVNTAGGLVGLGLIAVVHRLLGARTAGAVTPLLLLGTAFVLLVSGAFIASPVRFR